MNFLLIHKPIHLSDCSYRYTSEDKLYAVNYEALNQMIIINKSTVCRKQKVPDNKAR